MLLAILAACSFSPSPAPNSDSGAGDPDAAEPPTGDGTNLIEGCPASYTVDLTGDGFSKYRANPTALTWREAQDACVADGAGHTGATHLVVYQDDAERIATSATPLMLPRNSWVGLTDLASEGAFAWVTGEPPPVQSGTPMWGGANPDGGEPDDCIRISNSWLYDDKSCTTAEKSVCECDSNAANPATYP